MRKSAQHANLHSLAHAKACSAKALEKLAEHGLAPAPVNYAVLYEYCSGQNESLTKALDEHWRLGKPLDHVLLHDLYERHVAADQVQQLQGMGSDLQAILQGMMQSLNDMGSGAADFGMSLEKTLSSLNTEAGPQALKAIASEMLSATLEAQGRNSNLQSRLERTLQETDHLRKELEQYRHEAMVDPLTGLFNRRAMDAHMAEFMASDADAPLSVVALDIDHFKRINDTYGHAVGDVVIRNVAETMRKHIRDQDVAVRYGGEEFLLMLPNTQLEGALRIAEDIRSAIEALRLVRRSDNTTMSPFTISLGVATRRPEDDKDSLFQRADSALYQSKHGGRNRVTHEGLMH